MSRGPGVGSGPGGLAVPAPCAPAQQPGLEASSSAPPPHARARGALPGRAGRSARGPAVLPLPLRPELAALPEAAEVRPPLWKPGLVRSERGASFLPSASWAPLLGPVAAHGCGARNGGSSPSRSLPASRRGRASRFRRTAAPGEASDGRGDAVPRRRLRSGAEILAARPQRLSSRARAVHLFSRS